MKSLVHGSIIVLLFVALAAPVLAQRSAEIQDPAEPDKITVTGSLCGGSSIGKDVADAAFYAQTCLLGKPDYCGRDAPNGKACAVACFMAWKGVGVLFDNPKKNCERIAQILRIYPNGRHIIVVLDSGDLKCLMPEQLVKYGSYQLAHVIGLGVDGNDPRLADAFVVQMSSPIQFHAHTIHELRKACNSSNGG